MTDIRPEQYTSTRCDANDQRHLRHGRERDVGFSIGSYLQPPPLLFTRDGHNVFLGDLYRGYAAFLVCSGPSLSNHDLSLLQQRGILTLAVNNAATVVRPQLWTSVDSPGHFCDAIWSDPGILKFVPLDHMEKSYLVRDQDERLVPSRSVVGDMPGVFGFRRNEHFRAEQWLHESTFNWGNHSDRVDEYGNKGSRSVFYIALRLLYFLGVRTVYLVGCDFRMDAGQQNYAFEQDRSAGSIRSNNSSYRILNVRLGHLKPHFDANGFRVYNCTPESGLTVFPTMDYREAIDRARSVVPERIITRGMYDFKPTSKGVQTENEVTGPSVVESSPSQSESEPQVTISVFATHENLESLRSAWRTWESNHSWFRKAPVVVVLGRGDLSLVSRLEWLRDRPGAFQTVDGHASGDRYCSAQMVLSSAQNADRPWLLCLSPGVELKPGASGFDPTWFEQRRGSSLAFVVPRRTERPSSERVKMLREWARICPALKSSPEPAAGAFSFEGAICLLRTEWLRGLTSVLSTAPTGIPMGDVLGYLAARRGDQGLRVNFRQYGWEERRGPLPASPSQPPTLNGDGKGHRS